MVPEARLLLAGCSPLDAWTLGRYAILSWHHRFLTGISDSSLSKDTALGTSTTSGTEHNDEQISATQQEQEGPTLENAEGEPAPLVRCNTRAG